MPLKTTENQSLKVPRLAPVMVLPHTLLFPESHLPLFIFEERYRAMLAWALENDRMFCMALLRRDRSDWSSPADFHHIAGLGLVRACVARDDGTSHLVLQGLARVEFTGFTQTEPFVIAELREIPVESASPEESNALREMVLELCVEQRARGVVIPEVFEKQLAQTRDAGTLCDLVAQTLIRDPYRRQSVLEAGDVATRLRTLAGHLRDEFS